MTQVCLQNCDHQPSTFIKHDPALPYSNKKNIRKILLSTLDKSSHGHSAQVLGLEAGSGNGPLRARYGPNAAMGIPFIWKL